MGANDSADRVAMNRSSGIGKLPRIEWDSLQDENSKEKEKLVNPVPIESEALPP
jgi:hypothetical protein